ncbi:unnamed protein product [Acanthoscelides obtectus]|uniref:Uncharacterized protein n=1 Tax=Acanthoscelides obtectus TaxID=200917 RepID=A0A9P0QGA3_ACAOB|nr:unnamed protein product [Acanthoscelides obtectus]CAK1682760.1 hypothetical protein AOBTE_LOCUS33858 [Acanthoscelides obtectus]
MGNYRCNSADSVEMEKPSYYKIRGNDAYRMISIVNTS